MKKVIYQQFGGPGVLQLADVATPSARPSELLIRVMAVSVNPLDWKIRDGNMKLLSGTRFPKGIGIDFSGIVESTGHAVTRFKKGDAVFGLVDIFKEGALAEFIVVPEDNVALKSPVLTFEQAAALPVTGMAALQILDQLVPIKQGAAVLINGAAGGIGLPATQLAKSKGARVTAVVGSEAGALAVKELGADAVINYRKQDVLSGADKYDAVIDLSGKMPFSKARQIMKPVSAYVHTSPGPKQMLAAFVHNLFSKQKYKYLLLKPSAQHLNAIRDWADRGLKVNIGKTLKLTDFRKAFDPEKKGELIGKSVITLTGS